MPHSVMSFNVLLTALMHDVEDNHACHPSNQHAPEDVTEIPFEAYAFAFCHSMTSKRAYIQQ